MSSLEETPGPEMFVDKKSITVYFICIFTLLYLFVLLLVVRQIILLLLILFDSIEQCFPNLSWRTPCPAPFVCLSYLTYLIPLISSLVETAKTKLAVSDLGSTGIVFPQTYRTVLKP